MKLSKRTIIIAAAVLLVGVGGYAATREKKVAYETEKVDRGTVVEEVSVTGSLAPTRRIDLVPEVSGRVTKRNFEAGAEVKVGDIIIEIDSRDIAARVASQRAAVDAARARLAELVAGATPQELALAEASVGSAKSKYDAAVAAKVDAETSLANANAKVDTLAGGKIQALLLAYDSALINARDAMNRYTSAMFTTNDFLTISTTNSIAENASVTTRGEAKLRLNDLEAIIASARASGSADALISVYGAAAVDLASIQRHLEAVREVLNYTSGLSAATLATYQQNVSLSLSAVNSTINSLSAAKTDLEVQLRINTSDVSNAKSALTSATFAVESAQKALVQAQADLTLKQTGNRTEVLAGQRAQVSLQEASLASLVADLSKRRLSAPIDGIVTDVKAEIGETVQPGTAAASIQAKGNFEITTNISEIDIGKVTVGDAVHITLDAFPRTETWSGHVATIDPAEKVVEGVIFYETKIVFDKEDVRLRSGMTANLTIETDRREGVLRVPLRGLKERRGESCVDVLENGAAVEKKIVVGVQNSDHAELVSGLDEGTEVVVGIATK